jgi:hypothetical protein
LKNSSYSDRRPATRVAEYRLKRTHIVFA